MSTIIPREKILERWEKIPDELKEVLYDENLDEKITSFIASEGMDDDFFWIFQDILKAVLFGFIHPKNSYELFVEKTGESKKALKAYELLDEYVFQKFKILIQDTYNSFALSEEKDSREIETPHIEEKVILKKENPQVLDLKQPEISSQKPENAPVLLHQTGELSTPFSANIRINPLQQSSVAAQQAQNYAPMPPVPPRPVAPSPSPIPQFPFPTPPRFQQAPTPPAFIPASQPLSQSPIVQQPMQKTIPGQTASPVEQGPIIIHQKEESIPIAQMNKFKGYRNISAGGFMGSFGNIFAKHEDIQAPRASVQMPSVENVHLDDTDSSIPFTVKKFPGSGNTDPKTIHYSDYKTYISRRDE